MIAPRLSGNWPIVSGYGMGDGHRDDYRRWCHHTGARTGQTMTLAVQK